MIFETPQEHSLCHMLLSLLVDGDWYVRFMQVVREIIIKGKFKVATLTHIWVDW